LKAVPVFSLKKTIPKASWGKPLLTVYLSNVVRKAQGFYLQVEDASETLIRSTTQLILINGYWNHGQWCHQNQ